MDGFSIALSEITLVLFTTLAPSGAVAYLIMGLPLLAGRATGDAARRLSRMSCLPLVVAMVGLVASATHLGNPSNALYVFTGVGRSPLSTEVLCAVAFLALAANTVVYGLLGAELQGMENALASVAALVPAYPVCVAAFAILGAAGIATACCAGRRASGRRRIVVLSAGALLALAGIFVMRFVFYMTHLTVGLGV